MHVLRLHLRDLRAAETNMTDELLHNAPPDLEVNGPLLCLVRRTGELWPFWPSGPSARVCNFGVSVGLIHDSVCILTSRCVEDFVRKMNLEEHACPFKCVHVSLIVFAQISACSGSVVIVSAEQLSS